MRPAVAARREARLTHAGLGVSYLRRFVRRRSSTLARYSLSRDNFFHAPITLTA